MERTIVRLESEQKRALTMLAEHTGTSFAALVRAAIDEYLKRDAADAKIEQLDVVSRQTGRDIAHMIQALDHAIKHNQQVFQEINRLRRARGEDPV